MEAPAQRSARTSGLYYPFLEVRGDHHGASHDDLSDGYERISRFHLGQFAYLAAKLDAMPEGEGMGLDNTCLMFLSNMWGGWKHDNMKVSVVLAGGMGGALETGRSLNYLSDGDDNRRLCSLYLSLMGRIEGSSITSVMPTRTWPVCRILRGNEPRAAWWSLQ